MRRASGVPKHVSQILSNNMKGYISSINVQQIAFVNRKLLINSAGMDLADGVVFISIGDMPSYLKFKKNQSLSKYPFDITKYTIHYRIDFNLLLNIAAFTHTSISIIKLKMRARTIRSPDN